LNGTPDGKIERKTYSLGVVEALQDSLKRRDVYVVPSERWSDPRAKLLAGEEWESVRPQVLRTPELPSDPREYIEDLGCRLDEAYIRTAENAPHNAALRVVLGARGSEALDIASLDKLDEPDPLVELRKKFTAMLTRIDLVVNAVALWTSFYLGRAVELLREQEEAVREEDLARVSPLVREHVHVLGRYHFTLENSIAEGGVRPLRDPAEIGG
jgi:hypothetical protein